MKARKAPLPHVSQTPEQLRKMMSRCGDPLLYKRLLALSWVRKGEAVSRAQIARRLMVSDKAVRTWPQDLRARGHRGAHLAQKERPQVPAHLEPRGLRGAGPEAAGRGLRFLLPRPGLAPGAVWPGGELQVAVAAHTPRVGRQAQGGQALESKKNDRLSRTWPLILSGVVAMMVSALGGRRFRLWFQDEARLGTRPRKKRRLTARGGQARGGGGDRIRVDLALRDGGACDGGELLHGVADAGLGVLRGVPGWVQARVRRARRGALGGVRRGRGAPRAGGTMGGLGGADLPAGLLS